MATKEHNKIQNNICQALALDGWKVHKEFPARNRGDGRTGRIDIVAANDEYVVAIEIDTNRPRAKSQFKLNDFHPFPYMKREVLKFITKNESVLDKIPANMEAK